MNRFIYLFFYKFIMSDSFIMSFHTLFLSESPENVLLVSTKILSSTTVHH